MSSIQIAAFYPLRSHAVGCSARNSRYKLHGKSIYALDRQSLQYLTNGRNIVYGFLSNYFCALLSLLQSRRETLSFGAALASAAAVLQPTMPVLAEEYLADPTEVSSSSITL